MLYNIRMDIEYIKARNSKIINEFRGEYLIEYTVEELCRNFTSIYVHYDKEILRIRLLGTKELQGKKHKIQIAVIKKGVLLQLHEDQRMELFNGFSFVKELISELKTIYQLEAQENSYEEQRTFSYLKNK